MLTHFMEKKKTSFDFEGCNTFFFRANKGNLIFANPKHEGTIIAN